MAFIQRFALFLSHPLYAVAVVLAGFLVFAGLGSGASARLAARLDADAARAIRWAVAGIVIVAGVYLFALPPLFLALMPLPGVVKAIVSLALIAPLAFFMGMPFPLGLSIVSRLAPSLVPRGLGCERLRVGPERAAGHAPGHPRGLRRRRGAGLRAVHSFALDSAHRRYSMTSNPPSFTGQRPKSKI